MPQNELNFHSLMHARGVWVKKRGAVCGPTNHFLEFLESIHCVSQTRFVVKQEANFPKGFPTISKWQCPTQLVDVFQIVAPSGAVTRVTSLIKSYMMKGSLPHFLMCSGVDPNGSVGVEGLLTPFENRIRIIAV